MTKSYPIKIWSGLLLNGHTQKIENALWEFIWLVNKVTKEEDGIGYVLRGTPIKVDDICTDLKRTYQSVYRHLQQLKKNGYINMKKAPYGLIITVNNSKKFDNGLIKNDKAGLIKNDTRLIKYDTRLIKNDKANKILKDIKDNKDIKFFSQNSIEYQLAEYLYNKILKYNQDHKKPNMQLWAKHIDYMIRIDNRTPDKIKKVIDWCQQDDFWHAVILSTNKLREKFDGLVIKMKGRKNGKSKKHFNGERDYTDEDRREIEDKFYS